MMKNIILQFILWRRVFPLVLLSLLLAGCIYPGDISGPNGYGIACDKGRSCMVYKDGWKGIVGPEVESYAIVDQYIVGHCVPARTFPGKPNPDGSRGTGFFIVDTLKHTSSVTLNKGLWEQQLTQLGIPVPILQPTPFENKLPVGPRPSPLQPSPSKVKSSLWNK